MKPYTGIDPTTYVRWQTHPDHRFTIAVSESGFLIQEEGKAGLVAVFEDDGETGWLYLYEPAKADSGEIGILAAVPAYNRGGRVQPKEEDVWVTWSEDFSKCAVLVRGHGRPVVDDFRAIINIDDRRFIHKLVNGGSVGVQDFDWLKGFEWTWKEDRSGYGINQKHKKSGAIESTQESDPTCSLQTQSDSNGETVPVHRAPTPAEAGQAHAVQTLDPRSVEDKVMNPFLSPSLMEKPPTPWR